jgi:hypothetical protein
VNCVQIPPIFVKFGTNFGRRKFDRSGIPCAEKRFLLFIARPGGHARKLKSADHVVVFVGSKTNTAVQKEKFLTFENFSFFLLFARREQDL